MPLDVAHFVTLDRQDDSSRAGAEVSKLLLSEGPSDSFRFDAHAQWLVPDRDIGAYVAVPVSYRHDVQSTSALGDIELGGMLIGQLGGRSVVVLHAGITLPTQSASDDAQQASRETSGARQTDLYLTIPGGLSLRAGVSPIIRDGRVFVRADVGVDTNATSDVIGNTPTLIHLNAGVGADLGPAAVMVESTNVAASGIGGIVDTQALSARFAAGSVQLYGAYVAHIGGPNLNVALTFGIESRLP
jgi:hypothetical protein